MLRKILILLLLMPVIAFADAVHIRDSFNGEPHTHDFPDAFNNSLDPSATASPTIDNSPSNTAVSDQLAVNSVTLEAQETPTYTKSKIENTPDVLPPPVYPTVPCFKGGSFGGSIPGVGLSIGGGKIDPGCERREMIRLASQMGSDGRALFLWCSDEKIVEVFGSVEECLGFPESGNSGSTAVVPTTEAVAYCEKRSENIEEELVECLTK
jgi:hypothetical protein